MSEKVVPFKKKRSGAGGMGGERSSARLCAVQAVYQMLAAGDDAKKAVSDFLDYHIADTIEQQQIRPPDRQFFSKIVRGAESEKHVLAKVINTHFQKKTEGKQKNEKLLQSILLCGGYELLSFHEIDTAVILNEYINLGHAFFDQGEVRLINGLLDAMAKDLR